MADISMCYGIFKGEICVARDTCYRYVAKPSQLQSYFDSVSSPTNNCCYYIFYPTITVLKYKPKKQDKRLTIAALRIPSEET